MVKGVFERVTRYRYIKDSCHSNCYPCRYVLLLIIDF